MAARIKLFSPTELEKITLGQLFDMVTAWAPLDAAMETAKAEKDRRKSEFDKKNEEQFKVDTYKIAQDHAAGLAQITLVMSRHPEWFGKGGRIRTTDNAEFGYTKERKKVKVSDIDQLVAYAKKRGLKLYETEISPIMAAIKSELKEVDKIPGVEVTPGEDKPFCRAIMKNLDDSRKGK